LNGSDQIPGAGDGYRTHLCSLGSCHSTLTCTPSRCAYNEKCCVSGSTMALDAGLIAHMVRLCFSNPNEKMFFVRRAQDISAHLRRESQRGYYMTKSSHLDRHSCDHRMACGRSLAREIEHIQSYASVRCLAIATVMLLSACSDALSMFRHQLFNISNRTNTTVPNML
jgi:hypothetical protein